MPANTTRAHKRPWGEPPSLPPPLSHAPPREPAALKCGNLPPDPAAHPQTPHIFLPWHQCCVRLGLPQPPPHPTPTHPPPRGRPPGLDFASFPARPPTCLGGPFSHTLTHTLGTWPPGRRWVLSFQPGACMLAARRPGRLRRVKRPGIGPGTLAGRGACKRARPPPAAVEDGGGGGGQLLSLSRCSALVAPPAVICIRSSARHATPAGRNLH
jgi:hypothetical protein